MIHTLLFFSSKSRVFSSKHCTIMGKNRTTLTSCRIQRNLLRGARPETIPTENFDVANDNAAIYTNPQDFAASLKAAVDKMILKGFRTFKAGSCFADPAATRAQSSAQYSDEYFFRTEAIVVPVLVEGNMRRRERSTCHVWSTFGRSRPGHRTNHGPQRDQASYTLYRPAMRLSPPSSPLICRAT